MKKIREQIKKHEGLRLNAYVCSAGVLTVGYGRNCLAFPVPGVSKIGDKISLEKAEELFEEDFLRAENTVLNVFGKSFGLWLKEADLVRFGVLVDMAFNLGQTRFQGFKKMIRAVMATHFAEAAAEMTNSLWYKQVGGRAKTLVEQMRKGYL